MSRNLRIDLAYLFIILFGNILEDLVTKGLLEYQNSSYHLSSEGAKHGNYVFSQFIRE